MTSGMGSSEHPRRRHTIAPAPADITGVILAGGRGRRLGGFDKGLVRVADRPMIEWVLGALKPQVGAVMISANRHQGDYAAYGVPVVSDVQTGFQGPLAGMFSTGRRAATRWILTVPCDGPLLPTDLATRLIAAIATTGAELAVASDGASIQPVYALLPVRLTQSLETRLATRQHRVGDWIRSRQPAVADFADQPMAFANANTPDELASIEAMIARGHWGD